MCLYCSKKNISGLSQPEHTDGNSELLNQLLFSEPPQFIREIAFIVSALTSLDHGLKVYFSLMILLNSGLFALSDFVERSKLAITVKKD